MKFPCALHCLLNLLIPLYLLIQSLNNVKCRSWWPDGCLSMLVLIYILPANTLSICLKRSQICSKRKEIAIDKWWETNCDWSRKVEAGGTFTWLKCHLQQSQHPSHTAVGPVTWLQQRALWRQDQVTGAFAPHHFLLALRNMLLPWLSCTGWCREGTEGNH